MRDVETREALRVAVDALERIANDDDEPMDVRCPVAARQALHFIEKHAAGYAEYLRIGGHA